MAEITLLDKALDLVGEDVLRSGSEPWRDHLRQRRVLDKPGGSGFGIPVPYKILPSARLSKPLPPAMQRPGFVIVDMPYRISKNALVLQL